MKLMKDWKRKSRLLKEEKEKITIRDLMHWNDPWYVKHIEKTEPERYAHIVDKMKNSSCDCCMNCVAFYWKKEKINGTDYETEACSMGGTFENTDPWREVSKNCPLKEEEQNHETEETEPAEAGQGTEPLHKSEGKGNMLG